METTLERPTIADWRTYPQTAALTSLRPQADRLDLVWDDGRVSPFRNAPPEPDPTAAPRARCLGVALRSTCPPAALPAGSGRRQCRDVRRPRGCRRGAAVWLPF